MPMKTRLLTALVCAAVAACQTPSDSSKAQAGAGTSASTGTTQAPAPESKVPEGPAPGSPAAKAQAQVLLKQAAEQLNEGNEDAAREEITQALTLDPGNKTGTCLLRGLTADPVATLGRDSTNYNVRPGDTLGSVAQRALGDSCEFYLLARFNQVRVPSKLFVGQVLKIPGKVALTAPERTAKPMDAPAADTAAKPPAPSESTPSNFGSSRGAMKAAEVKAQIERYQRSAIAAFRKQDLATAIKEWDKLLELDPNNDLAKARRQEAIDLQRRLNQVK
jgi:LysM repeat protein